MTIDRSAPTPEQYRAAASPIRLRILRLCSDREWTNRQLAERLGKDPSTIHHHLKILTAAGFVEPLPMRTNDDGANEKPYRSTGLAWRLTFGVDHLAESADDEPPPLAAFREELGEAGAASIADFSRFHFRLSASELAELMDRIQEVLDDFSERTPDADSPTYSGIYMLHRAPDESHRSD